MSNNKSMTLEECCGCKYLVRLIALGLGARCRHPDNQKYKRKGEALPHLPIIISRIPSPCMHKKSCKRRK